MFFDHVLDSDLKSAATSQKVNPYIRFKLVRLFEKTSLKSTLKGSEATITVSVGTFEKELLLLVPTKNSPEHIHSDTLPLFFIFFTDSTLLNEVPSPLRFLKVIQLEV